MWIRTAHGRVVNAANVTRFWVQEDESRHGYWIVAFGFAGSCATHTLFRSKERRACEHNLNVLFCALRTGKPVDFFEEPEGGAA